MAGEAQWVGRDALFCSLSGFQLADLPVQNVGGKKVDNQINGTAAAYPCLVIERAAACDDDVVMRTLRAERRAFGPNLKP